MLQNLQLRLFQTSSSRRCVEVRLDVSAGRRGDRMLSGPRGKTGSGVDQLHLVEIAAKCGCRVRFRDREHKSADTSGHAHQASNYPRLFSGRSGRQFIFGEPLKARPHFSIRDGENQEREGAEDSHGCQKCSLHDVSSAWLQRAASSTRSEIDQDQEKIPARRGAPV